MTVRCLVRNCFAKDQSSSLRYYKVVSLKLIIGSPRFCIQSCIVVVFPSGSQGTGDSLSMTTCTEASKHPSFVVSASSIALRCSSAFAFQDTCLLKSFSQRAIFLLWSSLPRMSTREISPHS